MVGFKPKGTQGTYCNTILFKVVKHSLIPRTKITKDKIPPSRKNPKTLPGKKRRKPLPLSLDDGNTLPHPFRML
jgi:hypothetical protein